MKLLLSAILFFTIGLNINQAQRPSALKISTFKNVPDDLMGCGDDCYLSEKDKKQDILICRTDYATALIHINNKSIRLKANEKISHDKNEEIYTSDQYILSVKKVNVKQLDSEYYQFKGVITIKSSGKILYQQQIIGEGGC
ncbi:hypothetical protein ACPPVU_23125 [Mucilaginibacter sp. McL0603]|uniref:hypothetical protein n=1 Tax=Mucilaginibacter sp. McL0603 TaxID=3415670 RepID=UPI003CF2B47A